MKSSQVETLQVSAIIAAVAAAAYFKFGRVPVAVISTVAALVLIQLDKSRPAYKVRALPPPPQNAETTVEWEEPANDGPVSGYFTDAGEWIDSAGDYVAGIEDWISDNPF